VSLLIVALVAFVAFLRVESTRSGPLLDLTVFNNRSFANGLFMAGAHVHGARRHRLPDAVLSRGRCRISDRSRRHAARDFSDRRAESWLRSVALWPIASARVWSRSRVYR
jgi:hypothetical protein